MKQVLDNWKGQKERRIFSSICESKKTKLSLHYFQQICFFIKI